MKIKWLLAACTCFCCFSCSNPLKNTVPGTDLSAQDRADITLLAAHFSPWSIDSIWAGPTVHHGNVGPVSVENDFTGYVRFDSTYTDTDKISYQTLQFYNRFWYAYSAYGLPDSEMVFVNAWYSSPVYFSTVVKTVFRIGTLTVIAAVSGALDKPALVGFLNAVYAIQADTADTNHAKIPVQFSLALTDHISSTVAQDTTVINLTDGATYRFRFLAGDFLDAYAVVVPVPRR